MKITEIVQTILLKRELNGIPVSFAEEELSNYLFRKKIDIEKISPKETKVIVKDIRSSLRNYVGRFSSSAKKRNSLLHSGNTLGILKTHSSTKERIEYYETLKDIISSLNPKSILDLGCGINPIALAVPEIKYYASDLNENDLSTVRNFFKLNNIKGKVFLYDLRKIDDSLPETDITLILKTLDIIELKGNALAEKIISLVPSKDIIASFSTVSLSGRRMNHPQREWFEKILKKKGYSYEIKEIPNEIFYVIKK